MWPFSPSSTTPKPTPPPPPKPQDWTTSLNAINWSRYTEPGQVIPLVIVAAGTYVITRFHGMYLQRIAGATQIRPNFFRTRSLLGRVTSVGDGDGFHLFHTPGGRMTGWGWLRRVPKVRGDLRGKTIPIRIAGIDAPECAHFGKPAQPFATETLKWLTTQILHRRVRAYIWKRDQYDRIVATVYVRRGFLKLRRQDIGLEMLKQGMATTYEAKTGAEFGGAAMEKRYKEAEEAARKAKKGMWALKGVESPMDFKRRMKEQGNGNGGG